MADRKITDLDPSAGLAAGDLIEVVDDPAGTPDNQKATFTQVAAITESINAAATRTPSAHAASHFTGGGDALTPGNIGAATASDLSTHIANVANPHSVTAAQISAAPSLYTQRSETTSTSITSARANERLLVAVNGTDLYVQLEDSCVAGQRSIVTRGDLGGGGDVIIIGVDGDHIITGPTILTRALDTIEMRLDSISGATYYWVTSRKDVYEDMEIRATHTSATRTVAARDRGTRTPLDPTSNTIAVTLPHTLPVGFECEFVALNVTNAITFAGSGGLGLTYYGDSTITAGDIIRISVESATVCRVEVVHTGALSGPSSGTDGALLVWDGVGGRLVADSGLLAIDVVMGISDADTKATDALYPLVQSAHTSATKTLASGDAGDIIPLNAASNAIAVTIPHTLFEAGGAGRAWVCQCKVTSVAGGAVTFVGSGGIVVSYSGKNPGTDAYIAGDYITIVVDSATTARVFAVESV